MLRKSIFLLSTAALLACCININPTSVEAKGNRAHRGAYLVPPPPAYAPSILPNMGRNSGLLAYSREVSSEEPVAAETAEPTEARVVHIKVYGPSSHIIKPVVSRKGVSFYN